MKKYSKIIVPYSYEELENAIDIALTAMNKSNKLTQEELKSIWILQSIKMNVDSKKIENTI